jgi:hypothetical protein
VLGNWSRFSLCPDPTIGRFDVERAPPIYSPHRLPRRDERYLAWRELPRPLLLATLRDTVNRLLQFLEDRSHRTRGERLSPLQPLSRRRAGSR